MVLGLVFIVFEKESLLEKKKRKEKFPPKRFCNLIKDSVENYRIQQSQYYFFEYISKKIYTF